MPFNASSSHFSGIFIMIYKTKNCQNKYFKIKVIFRTEKPIKQSKH